MQIELSAGQIAAIIDQAKKKVEAEALAKLREAVQRDLPQWVREVKNAARGAVADAVTVKVMQQLDVNGCVDKAMENVNKRIHTELTHRLANGINVTFAATVANPVVPA